MSPPLRLSFTRMLAVRLYIFDVAASDADYHRDDEPVPVGDYRLDQVVHRESNVFLLLYVVIRGVRFDIVGCHALIVKIIG